MRRTRWRRDRLINYQNQQIRKIVKHAYDHVPFYHRRFKQLGLKPNEIKGAEDLKRMPIIRKRQLQEHYRAMISTEFDMKKLLVQKTSGSTGIPLSVYITTKEDELRKSKLLRANIACGQRPRDRWVVITEPQSHTRKFELHRMFGIYAPVSMSVLAESKHQISLVDRLNPQVLEGYSTSLFLFAREIESRGIETIRPNIVIGGAELTDRPSRLYMEEVFMAPFYDQYSSVEFEALSWQCTERTGYHIDADTVVIQFVDENQEEVALGEEGEVVCTSLFNYAMPLIRYSLDDIGALSENTECSCGITFPLMKLIAGRKDSIIVLPDGRSLSPLVIGDGMMFFKFFEEIEQYRIIQRKIDLFKILIKKRNARTDPEIFEASIVDHLKRLLNANEMEIEIDVEFADEIPLERSGKLRKVVSELQSNSRR